MCVVLPEASKAVGLDMDELERNESIEFLPYTRRKLKLHVELVNVANHQRNRAITQP